MESTPLKIYKRLRTTRSKYIEEKHCPLILEVMMNQGRVSAFCTEALICERTFNTWVKTHQLFGDCYYIGKMFAREKWEKEGYDLRTQTNPPGVISHEFEHWKMIGWSRFGVSHNSRIKLDLDPNGNPSQHFTQLLVQASNGDFTASEIKQLMETLNIGINVYKVNDLQEEINKLKSDLATMVKNRNDNHNFSDKGTA